METAIEKFYKCLTDEFGLKNAVGQIKFNLKNVEIVVKENDTVGNIIEEWVDSFMTLRGFDHIHNPSQSAPDFWMNPTDLRSELLEIKCFQGSPNFDIANFKSYITEIIDKPFRLHSKYLIIKYKMDSSTGDITIENVWLKDIWEITCSSDRRPIRVQEKSKIIYNIRPSTFFSSSAKYKSFQSLGHFISALEQTIYDYSVTRSTMAEKWLYKLQEAYHEEYGIEIVVPRWFDIKQLYTK